MDASADLGRLVAEMRALGVTRLKTPTYEIELGAAPPPQHVAEPAKTETAEERQKRIQAEHDDLLFASSESGTPFGAPSLGGRA